MTEEVENAVERKPSDHNPKARSETDSGQSRKDRKKGDFGNKVVAAPSHHSKQDIQRANNRQNDRIKRPIAVVANHMREQAC